ncbi:MAG: hypothetical protein EZS28_006354, partial [Streblomastix strix]
MEQAQIDMDQRISGQTQLPTIPGQQELTQQDHIPFVLNETDFAYFETLTKALEIVKDSIHAQNEVAIDYQTTPNSILFIPGIGSSNLLAEIKQQNGSIEEKLVWPLIWFPDKQYQRYLFGQIDPISLKFVPFESNVEIKAQDKDFGLYGIDSLIHLPFKIN